MKNLGLSESEIKILKKLNTPVKIQDFLDTIPMNFEKNGETYISPRKVLRKNKAHCFEGALFAAVCLWFHGGRPLLLDLKSNSRDSDHVVALYKINGFWGAISKTNHASLRFRDPVYKTMRELALSYFHEYFINKTGEKTLIAFSKPFNLTKFGKNWITAEEDLDFLVDALDKSSHTDIVPVKNKKIIRKADKTERKAGKVVEWIRK